MNAYEMARYRAGLSLADAAEKAGIDSRTITRLERGEVKKAGAPIVKALATTYGTTVDTLLGLEEAA